MFQVSQNGGHIYRFYILQGLQIIPLASQELYSVLVSAKLSFGEIYEHCLIVWGV